MDKYVKFFGKEWANLLNEFLVSEEYKTICKAILKDETSGFRVTPEYKNIFRAFLECPYYSIHTVIIGTDVYDNRTKNGNLVADGIAFSAKDSITCPKPLNFIYEAIDQNLFEGKYDPKHGFDLKPWANQGILLINCGLTTAVGHIGRHITLWKPFIQFLIKKLCENKDSLGIILMGNYAKEHRKSFTNKTYGIFECENPLAAVYRKGKWEHNNVFSDLVEFHKKNNIKIQW